MMQKLHGSRERRAHKEIVFDSEIDKVIVIDQSPIGRTPRSNPVTYTKVFDEVRTVFAGTKEAKMRGYKPGRFSFNIKGGRCEACEGDGLIKIEMDFLPDVYIECEECKGKRYNRETLEVKYKGKSIADVLDIAWRKRSRSSKTSPRSRANSKCSHGSASIMLSSARARPRSQGGEAQRISSPGTRQACDRENALPAGRADHRASLRRHEETDQGARQSCGEGQHRSRDRAQSRCDQVCGLPHRHRA